METVFLENEMFRLAADVVRNTSRSVFLTGKAGSGKTTFLRYIREHVSKNCIVAAPTGIAAINAGGVTLHSLLQLPFEPYLPDFEGRKKLDYHSTLRKAKIDMLRELELLIVDEVSMLRADTLDAIDFLLRRYRNNSSPFGGVQLLLIGDMFQLPPVVQPQEWNLLRNYYPSPFFFQAKALELLPLLHIEFDHIYRQKDNRFIGILNHIRNGCISNSELQELNNRFDVNGTSHTADGYVILSTHNYKADRINVQRLADLDSKEFVYQAKVSGDFNENSFPAEQDLRLKVGAQVMFIKNDQGEKRRYYNGKLAKIVGLKENKITVCFDDGSSLDLQPEIWSNVRYRLNAESGEIEEDLLGTFSQFPIRLAWAITIHKSQGLTFDRVVIDAGDAFASGQVYVALSRCTTLEGIVLCSRITQEAIRTDRDILAFSSIQTPKEEIQSILLEEAPAYCRERLKAVFDMLPVIRTLQAWQVLASEKKIPEKEEVLQLVSSAMDKADKLQEVCVTFRREIDRILAPGRENVDVLKDRVCKAAVYFYMELSVYVLKPLNQHVDALRRAAKVKAYLTALTGFQQVIDKKTKSFSSIYYGSTNLTGHLCFEVDDEPESTANGTATTDTKARKGDSLQHTLQLFKEGCSVADICKQRNLALSTVQSHLSMLVSKHELSVFDLIPETKLKKVSELILHDYEVATLTELLEKIPVELEIGYFELRLIVNYLKSK